MKNLFVISFLIFSFSAFGQMKGRVYYLDVDTSKGADTVSFELPKITGSYSTLTIESYFENVGGTSDGIAFLQSSPDTVNGGNFITLDVDYYYLFSSYPSDTVTITDGIVAKWVIAGVPDIWYKVIVHGTSGDTTKVTTKYLLK